MDPAPPLPNVRLAASHETEDAVRAIRDGLRDYNLRFAPPSDWTALTVIVSDAGGRVVGGCAGETGWGQTGRGWLHVALLWLDDAFRGRGLGTRLIAAAEAEALRRGCTRAFLDTITFQARPFYERNGYAVFATQHDFPPGYERFFMQKTLAAPGDVKPSAPAP